MTTTHTARNRFSPLADRLHGETAQRVTRGEEAAIRSGTHSLLVGYLTWLFGFTGSHRFYYGKPITGTIWFFTLGLLGVGWLIDLFLIPSLHRSAERRYVAGEVDYNMAWILLTFLGPLGIHRLYLGKWATGLFLLIVGPTAFIAFPPIVVVAAAVYLYDFLTLNEQITAINTRAY